VAGGERELVLLRGIREDVSQIKDDMTEVKERLSLLEAGYASLSRRVDRIGGDVERIKTRLDLVDAPASAGRPNARINSALPQQVVDDQSERRQGQHQMNEGMMRH